MARKLGKHAKLDLILAELSALRADIKNLLEPKGTAAERSARGVTGKKAAARSAKRKSVKAPAPATDKDDQKQSPLAVAGSRA
jgi:hypothetical protein